MKKKRKKIKTPAKWGVYEAIGDGWFYEFREGGEGKDYRSYKVWVYVPGDERGQITGDTLSRGYICGEHTMFPNQGYDCRFLSKSGLSRYKTLKTLEKAMRWLERQVEKEESDE